MFASSSLGEKGAERVVSSCLVGRHGAIRLNSMFKAVEFPASITNLNQKKILKVIFKRIKKTENFTWAPAWPTWIDKHSRIFASFFQKEFLRRRREFLVQQSGASDQGESPRANDDKEFKPFILPLEIHMHANSSPTHMTYSSPFQS